MRGFYSENISIDRIFGEIRRSHSCFDGKHLINVMVLLPQPPTRSNQNYTEPKQHFRIFSDRVALVCIKWKPSEIPAKHSNNLKISHTQPSGLICILQSKTFYSFNANSTQLRQNFLHAHLKSTSTYIRITNIPYQSLGKTIPSFWSFTNYFLELHR